jgi:hypothetical protein
MSAGPLDTTKYNNMVNNAAARVKISSTVFKAFIADVKEKIDANYAVSASVTQQAIINGNFAVNQRVKSGTVTLTAGQYGHDRWKAGASGCTYTFSTSNNVTTITITAGSLIQAIEGINLYSGTYTLSWTGTAQGKIGTGSYSASGVTGTIVGGTNTNIEFNTGTLSKVQFNAGSIALPFQPRSFAEELAMCQRYYWKTFDQNIAPAQISGNLGGVLMYRIRAAGAAMTDGILVRYPVRMRVIPSVTFYNPQAANNRWRNFSIADSGVPTAQAQGESGCFVDNPQVSGDALANLMLLHMTADAEL